MVTTFVILAITIALFVFSKLRADLVALLALLALTVTGVLTAPQALAGFADSTTIMVAALFVVGEGLSRTGITAWLGQQLMRGAGDSAVRLLLVMMLGTALLSGFMSNTGTVAMLLPAVVVAAWRVGSTPAKFLLPLALAANLGGLLTLIGSPPNIVVADTLTAAGLKTFGFFEFAALGLPLLATALLFMALIGRRLLPEHSGSERPLDLDQALQQVMQSYRLPGKLFWLLVRPESAIAGQTLAATALGRDFGVSVLSISRPFAAPMSQRKLSERLEALVRDRLDTGRSSEAIFPAPTTVIHAGDLLLVKGNPQTTLGLSEQLGIEVQPVDESDRTPVRRLLSQEIGAAEVIVAPRSDYAGRTLAEGQIGAKFGVQVVALQRGANVLARQDTPLQPGDALLVRGPWAAIERLANEQRNFVVVGNPDALARQVVQLTPRSAVAALIMAGMVALMVSGLVPTVTATLLAAAAMVLAGCVTPEGAYRAINWQAVVLIAGTLPLSTALQVTGGAGAAATLMVNTVGAVGPLALLAGVFLLTTLLSQVMSNTATTVLLAPIVLQVALDAGYAPQPLLMMVAAGAAAAFLTPIASPTNALVFAPGGYTWGNYAKVGAPLVALTLLVSLVVVPLVWPL